jgi:uncharacterized membrane protein HdeD (DUF308 family)
MDDRSSNHPWPEANLTNHSFDVSQGAIAKALGEHWKLFLIEGIVLVILGLLAVAVPPLAGLAITIIFGWLFLISGVAGLITTFAMRQAPGFLWSLLSGVLGILAGGLLLVQPALGLVTLTYVLIAFFVLEGAATIMFALDHRQMLSGRWGFVLASGLVDLFLATIILMGLPGTAAWALGIIVGINLVFGGVSLIAMALAVRSPNP